MLRFDDIAEIIKAMPTHAASLRAARRSAALAFADACAIAARDFDRDSFLRACGEMED